MDYTSRNLPGPRYSGTPAWSQSAPRSKRLAAKAREGWEIVCGTNFSVLAAEAATAAAAISARASAKLILVHVADETNTHFRTREDLETFLPPIQKSLQIEAERVSRDGACVETKLLTGSWAEDALVEYVSRQPPDLIILAGARKGAIDRWTLGNVCEKLAQQAPVPTMVIRSALGLVMWAQGRQALNVFVGTDLSSESDTVIEWVRSLHSIGDCFVTLGHAYIPEPARARYGLSSYITITDLPSDLHNDLETILMEKGKAILGEDIPLQVRVVPGGVQADTPLVEMARQTRADLLVVGTHQRHGFDRLLRGSVSRGVMRSAPINVACVPLQKNFLGEIKENPRTSNSQRSPVLPQSA